MTTVTLRPLALADACDPSFTHLFLGRRASGKSTALKHLCYRLRAHFPTVVVISPTAAENGFFHGWVPPELIYPAYSEVLVDSLIHRNRRLIAENAVLAPAQRISPRLLLILDDCITQREASHSRALESIFVLGRHVQISVIMTTQHAAAQNAVPPIIRVNTDFVWVAAQSSQAAVDMVVDTWLSGCSAKRDAEGALHSTTRSAPYTFLVIDARRAARSTSLSQFCYSFVAASLLPKFRMGAPRWWRDHAAVGSERRLLDQFFVHVRCKVDACRKWMRGW
jgi:hypothetical protein